MISRAYFRPLIGFVDEFSKKLPGTLTIHYVAFLHIAPQGPDARPICTLPDAKLPVSANLLLSILSDFLFSSCFHLTIQFYCTIVVSVQYLFYRVRDYCTVILFLYMLHVFYVSRRFVCMPSNL